MGGWINGWFVGWMNSGAFCGGETYQIMGTVFSRRGGEGQVGGGHHSAHCFLQGIIEIGKADALWKA